MRALILVGTLKGPDEHSNTMDLAEQLADALQDEGVGKVHIRHLLEMGAIPSGKGDLESQPWRQALVAEVEVAEILVIATPIWWNNHSSVVQCAIEALDDLQDARPQIFGGKVGGVIVQGHEDGAQHVTGNLLNFMHWLGITVPPKASVTWVGEQGADMAQDTERRRANSDVDEMIKKAAYNLVQGAHAWGSARFWV